MYINSIGNSLLHAMNHNQREVNKSAARLSTGVMLPSDNPVDFVRGSRMEAELRESRVLERNIQDGISFLELADESLSYVDQMGKRLRELSIQYQAGTLSDEGKAIIQTEAKALVKEMVDVIKNTEFNGKKVFGSDSINIQIGLDKKKVKNSDIKRVSPNTTISENKGSASSFKGISDQLNSPLNARMVLVAYGGPTYSEIQKRKISATAEESSIPRYTIPFRSVYIPDQNGYTGYKRITDEKGKLLYEGNLTHGKLDGYGKLYDSNNKVVYEGDWNNGVYDGYGTVYNKNGKVLYRGDIKDGVVNGFGTFYNANGDISYQGSLRDGFREGWGQTNDGCSSETKDYTDYTDYHKQNNGTGNVGNTGETGNNGINSDTGNNSNAGNTGGSLPGDIGDWGKANINDLLNDEDSIDKILDQILNSRGDIGIMQSIMERRLQFTENMGTIKEEWLTRLNSTDMAKEIMKKTKHEMLQQVNTNLVNTMIEQYRSMVLTLLRSI
ncbi:flagellin (plasmid) [Brevibacillus halotolerans]|nr:flagellin [Brevibacillus halotolerans]